MPKFGIIGDPVRGSLSPRMFPVAFGGRYGYDLIEGSDFERSWERFLAEYRAVNVTAPFKEAAFRRVRELAVAGKGEISGPAFRIGATNLLLKRDDGIVEAHNSDFTGVVLSLAEHYFPGVIAACLKEFGARFHVKVHQYARLHLRQLYPERPQALVIGCGGAGRAAAVAAAELGFETALMNRTPERAQRIADELPEYGFLCVPMSDLPGAVRECDLVIYTVPEPVPALAALSADVFAGEGSVPKVILEANYKTPSFSGDIAARMAYGGAEYVSGRDWWFYQAVTGYGIMAGEPCDIAAMAEFLQEISA